MSKDTRGVGKVTGHNGEKGDAYKFDQKMGKFYKGPEFVKEINDVSRKTHSFIVTANLKLDRDSYGTLYSLETERDGKMWSKNVCG